MKEHEYIARQRYRNDPQYYGLVNFLEKFMNETKISHNEIHDAVNLAADIRNRLSMRLEKMRGVNDES